MDGQASDGLSSYVVFGIMELHSRTDLPAWHQVWNSASKQGLTRLYSCSASAGGSRASLSKEGTETCCMQEASRLSCSKGCPKSGGVLSSKHCSAARSVRSPPGRVQPDPEVQELQQSSRACTIHDAAVDRRGPGQTSLEDTRHPLAPDHVVPSPSPLGSPQLPDPFLNQARSVPMNPVVEMLCCQS